MSNRGRSNYGYCADTVAEKAGIRQESEGEDAMEGGDTFDREGGSTLTATPGGGDDGEIEEGGETGAGGQAKTARGAGEAGSAGSGIPVAGCGVPCRNLLSIDS